MCPTSTLDEITAASGAAGNPFCQVCFVWSVGHCESEYRTERLSCVWGSCENLEPGRWAPSTISRNSKKRILLKAWCFPSDWTLLAARGSPLDREFYMPFLAIQPSSRARTRWSTSQCLSLPICYKSALLHWKPVVCTVGGRRGEGIRIEMKSCFFLISVLGQNVNSSLFLKLSWQRKTSEPLLVRPGTRLNRNNWRLLSWSLHK